MSHQLMTQPPLCDAVFVCCCLISHGGGAVQVEQRRFLVQPFSILSNRAAATSSGAGEAGGASQRLSADFTFPQMQQQPTVQLQQQLSRLRVAAGVAADQGAVSSWQEQRAGSAAFFTDAGQQQQQQQQLWQAGGVLSGPWGPVVPRQVSYQQRNVELQAQQQQHHQRHHQRHQGALGKMASSIWTLRPKLLKGELLPLQASARKRGGGSSGQGGDCWCCCCWCAASEVSIGQQAALGCCW
jgi:hypothetical protein